MKKNVLIGSLLAATMLVACRGGGSDDGNGDGNTPDGGGGDDTSIIDIQNGTVAAGTKVRLAGVVVTAIDTFGSRVGGVYVAEPEGGAYSGVLVFNPTVTGGVGSLAVGDLVNVEGGEVDEFALTDDTSGRTMTEISPPMGGTIIMTKTGEGTVPEPSEVDPAVFAAANVKDAPAAANDEAEKWEGVLVVLKDVSVVQAPHTATASDPTIYELEVSGPAPVQNSLTEIKDVVGDTCYGDLIGMVDYFFDFKVLPRSQDDLVQGTACGFEKDMATCTDEIDNDRDGRIDCAEFSCQAAIAACTTNTTIAMIQSGTVVEGSKVSIPDVTVTAVNQPGRLVWVQDGSVANGQYAGIVVHYDVAGATYPVVGNKVTVVGNVDEYFGLTRIDAAITGITDSGTAGTVVTPTKVSLATLGAEVTAEPYESVLVTIENVKVVTVSVPNDPATAVDETFEWTVGSAAAPFRMGSRMFARPASVVVDACFPSITGPIDYSFNVWKLQPRTAADVAAVNAAACL